MRQSAPFCALLWKTAPCQWMTALMASIKTKMDVSSASALPVSSRSSFHAELLSLRMAFRDLDDIYLFAYACVKKNLAIVWFWLQRQHADIHQSLFVSLQDALSQACSCDQPLCMSRLCCLMDCSGHDQLTSLNSFRWLLSWLGKILFSAMSKGIWKGWFWLWGVWVQHPHIQVPTTDLLKDLPLRICVCLLTDPLWFLITQIQQLIFLLHGFTFS